MSRRNKDNTFLYASIGTGVVALGGLTWWLTSRKSSSNSNDSRFNPYLNGNWRTALAEADQEDRVAEIQRNIILPSSLASDKRVLSAKIYSISRAGIQLEIEYIYNAGYSLVLDEQRTKTITDREGGHATRWSCFDFERCDIEAIVKFAPNPASHSRTGAGLSDAEVALHGQRTKSYLTAPVCLKYCKDDNTYAGQINVKYIDDISPDTSTMITRPDGKPLRFTYGEEAKSDCTNTNSSWYRKENMCND